MCGQVDCHYDIEPKVCLAIGKGTHTISLLRMGLRGSCVEKRSIKTLTRQGSLCIKEHINNSYILYLVLLTCVDLFSVL